MCGLFRNRFRAGSCRYRGYDYSLPGMYYVTIYTKNKTHYFGEIKNGKMILSKAGEIAQQILTEIPVPFPFTGQDEFVIMSSISPSPGSLATIIRSFKSAVTKTIHKTGPDFEWQPRFYDHIIRTGIELSRIRDYIKSNPKKWNSR